MVAAQNTIRVMVVNLRRCVGRVVPFCDGVWFDSRRVSVALALVMVLTFMGVSFLFVDG